MLIWEAQASAESEADASVGSGRVESKVRHFQELGYSKAHTSTVARAATRWEQQQQCRSCSFVPTHPPGGDGG
ncbi:MAG: hypothetical protein ACK55I_28450, partial [bacterium]